MKSAESRGWYCRKKGVEGAVWGGRGCHDNALPLCVGTVCMGVISGGLPWNGPCFRWEPTLWEWMMPVSDERVCGKYLP